MDPVSASIIITTIGWLAKPLYKKAVDIAYQKFTKRVGLQAETDNVIAELKSFKVPKETAEATNCLQEVKELVRQAKDLLDELDYFRLQDEVEQMNRAENGNTFTKFKSSDVPSSSTGVTFKQLKFDKRGMSNRMKDLCKKLKCYTCQSKNSHVEHELLSKIVERIEKENNSVLPTNRQTDSFFPEVQIFGRDAEIKQIQKLINHIEKHPQELSVIAIVGQGGVGKTTVAQEVYRKLTPSFGTKMWVCVSSDFDEREITCQMLEYCYNVRYDRNSNKNFLKTKLGEYLKEKKFLLVLDDIWEMSETEWKSLLAPLNVHTTSNNTGSMVLVTTRYPFIANMVSTIDPIYLDKLDDGSFWSFFIKCAFGDARYNVPTVLEAIGRKIVEKLSGNPLAAKTVGNLLKGQNDPTKWAEILNSGEWKFVEAKDGIMPTLRLSYEYLPLHLKQCFSYCSLFPKDHYFKADDLVYMWMAHDFINENDEIVKNFHQKNKKRVEDVGFEYLNILVERAFFQQIVTDWGQVVYVMHDLAQVVSSEKCLAINHGEPTPIPPHLCHLSFLLEVKYTIENHVQLQDLSSLVIFENNKSIQSTLNWDQAIRVCLHLLILPYMRAISYNFSYFTHLRYLKLNVYSNGNEKAEFPVQICRLYHLQVLELEDSYIIVNELPKQFNNLVNLRHFIAHDYLHSKIAGVSRLKHLQELKKFVVRGQMDFGIGQLSKLKELKRSLQICSLQNVKNKEEAECARLSEKEIAKLKLHWDEETKDKPWQNSVSRGEIGGKQRRQRQKQNRGGRISDASSEEILVALRPNNDLRDIYIENYGGCISPTWLTDHSIKYLESIHLSNCQAWEELPNFGQLMCLKVLYLWNLPRVKAFRPQFHGSGPQEGFPSLKLMDVRSMFELKTWVWSPYNTFPSLEKLYVSGCPNLIEFSLLELIPIHGEKAQWFSKLEYLNITNCPKLQQGGFGGVQCLTLKAELEIHSIEDPKVLAFMIRALKNIGSITINDCPNFTSLSWKCICMLHCLKRLQFERCHGLCFSLVVEEEKDDGSTFYSHESLQELKIHECSVTGDELSYLMAHLPAIRQLSIKNATGYISYHCPASTMNPTELPWMQESGLVKTSSNILSHSCVLKSCTLMTVLIWLLLMVEASQD